MTEIAVRHPMELATKMDYARAMASSNLLPKQYQNNPANLLFALEYADALGVAPINAITSIHVIEGKPSASADLIASMVRKAGHKLRVTGDDTYALAQIIRADDPEFTYEARWDMAKARAASLTGKGVWKNYPGAMLRARAITEVARAGASDALFGVVYTPEELGAAVGIDGNPVEVVEPAVSRSGSERLRSALEQQAPAAPAEEPVKAMAERVEDAITASQLKALNAALTSDLGFTDRDDKIAFLCGELGREIASSKDVTKAEASALLDKLTTERNARAAKEPADTGPAEPPLDGAEWPEVKTGGAR